jgi:hypothetical protein
MAEEAAPAAQPLGNESVARDQTGTLVSNPPTETKPEATLETKPESTEAKPEVKAEEKPAKAEPGKVPDAYTLTAPEGYEIDPKVVEEITPVLKELGLDNAAAQKLADIWNKHSIESANAAMKQYETLRGDWRSEVIKNPALGDGREGLKADAKANIARAIDSVGDAKAVSDLKAALDLTGAGDHPAVIAAFNAFGKLLGEGTLVRGGSPSPEGQRAPGTGPKNAAQALFPNLPSSANS